MASITLSRIDENLSAAGCSRAMFAVVCGLKPSTLSAAYGGVVNLGGPREAEMLTTSHALLTLCTSLEPLSLPGDANVVRKLVQRLDAGTLTVERIRAAVHLIMEDALDCGTF